MNNALWYLENIDVNGLFCPQKVGSGGLTEKTHITFKRGEYIYLPKDQADKVYFITSGRVKIGTYSDNKEITKAILNDGEVFGELALIGEDERRDFAYAMETVECCVLSMDEIRGLMREHSGLNLFMMRIIGSRLLDMEKRLESLVFKDSRTRVIEFLVDLAEKKGQRIGYEIVVRKFMTHQEIANLTATSRQTVTTILNELRNDNIITFNRRRLLIRDMERLEKRSES